MHPGTQQVSVSIPVSRKFPLVAVISVAKIIDMRKYLNTYVTYCVTFKNYNHFD